jgi:hypothetical protein
MTSRGVVIRTTQLPAQAPATTSRDSVIKPPSPDGGLGGGARVVQRAGSFGLCPEING